jgi:excisionase family DNA binding protein
MFALWVPGCQGVSAVGADVIPFRPRDSQQEPWLRERQLAQHFGVSERTIRRWRHAGMPSKLLGGSRRFRLSDVEAWHQAAQAERGAS